MLGESTYSTGVVHARWVDQEQCDTVTVPTYFDRMPVPRFLKPMIVRTVRKKMVRDAQGHGTANVLADDQVRTKFAMELKALSDYLGDKKYLMGSRITSFDATVFAYMVCLSQGNWNHANNKAVRECPNIMAYVQRMREEFWPDSIEKTK